jgi:crotonobetaine/carnitine-CoA ligase
MDPSFDSDETPLRELFAASKTHAEDPFLTIDGRTATYGEAARAVRTVGSGLKALGVKAGDRVVLLMPNMLEAVWAWFGVQSIGAIDAPISVEAPGPFLQYLVNDLHPTAVIGTEPLLARLAEHIESPIPVAVVVGDGQVGAPMGDQTRHVSFPGLLSLGETGAISEAPSAYLPGTILYSSGTTGPSKGVILPQGYMAAMGRAHIAVYEWEMGSRLYCAQPLVHVDGRSAVVDALLLRGHVRLGVRFSASRFWDEVEDRDADCFFFVGTMIHLLSKQPVRDSEKNFRRRLGIGSATPAAVQHDFEQRFNVELVESYGMTELGIMTSQRRGQSEPGHIGQALPWVDLRIVDERGEPVERGTSGELVARPKVAHVHMLGYWNRPEATLDAWRGWWFHTGDLMRQDAAGNFYYIGRLKDSIRRRGENVSAWEVEDAATRSDKVLEAAAIGVPSDLGDEDVALLVVPTGLGPPDPEELRELIAEHVPRFAVPRFIEIVEQLPKTPSERIAKGKLRDRGVTAAAYDAEANRSSEHANH